MFRLRCGPSFTTFDVKVADLIRGGRHVFWIN